MRTVFVIALFLAFAKAAYAEDGCAKKSVAFAFCINAAYLDNTPTAKTKSELEQALRTECGSEMSAYNDCDQIDKSAFVNEFIQKKVESFKKDTPKAVARLHQIDQPEQDSSIN